ncbi:helix-turn-helix domain-containing protein [Rhizobium pusense]|uniref:helix-turn-helix domain-containing protein n=1 Tax=Agrobacterium pusense TaxID=648995 RepID=UPI001C6E8B8F|nr:helix-turn-helix domain-containing protein [Agrobacterium pusense]
MGQFQVEISPQTGSLLSGNQQARQLLAAGGMSVSKVAFSVGYVSPPQFSREYKSMFGTPPTNDLARSISAA